MTGDNFYPSVRAAYHRISGHLELSRQVLVFHLKDNLSYLNSFSLFIIFFQTFRTLLLYIKQINKVIKKF
jgi:hypothetical protein